VRADGTLDLAGATALLLPADTTAFYELSRSLLIEGRLSSPDAADEITVDEVTRDAGHPVGSEVNLCVFNFFALSELGDALFSDPTPEVQRQFVDEVCEVHRLRVVGVTDRGPDEVVLREDSESDGFITGTPALAARTASDRSFSFVVVDLEPGADVNTYVDAVLDQAPQDAGVSVQAAALQSTVVSRTVEPYVRALILFAAIAAIAAAGVLGPAVVRWTANADGDRAPLIATGVRRHQLRLASALRGAAMGAIAAAGALVIAVVASGQFPIGVAARIEPDPGVRIDGPVLAVGAAFVVALCAALGAAAPTSSGARAQRPSRVADGLAARGVAPARVAGVRVALSREAGVGRVSTAAGIAIAIGAVVTALTFQAGLTRLLETPARYGWTWDAVVDSGDADVTPELVDAIAAEQSVTAVTAGRRSTLLRDGSAIPTFAFEPVRGSAYPTIVDGRAPRGDAEVALGGQTLDRLGATVGDRVTFRGPNGARVTTAVVGRTLIPVMNLGQDLSIAEGALVDGPLLERIGGAPVSLAIVDLMPGATPEDLRRALERRGIEALDSIRIGGAEHTADLRGYDQVRGTPLLLAALLAVLGVGVLAHTILSTTRRRRRELAVLQGLGFARRDVRTSVRWSALTVVGASALVAVPLGIGAGRVLWSSFARAIGVPDDPITPWLQVASVVAVAIAGAAALGELAGRGAGTERPADALRTE
jgi:hypothetical protein